MKIYEFKGFPNPARVRIALAEKGLTDAVAFVSVDVPNGEHKTPEFLAKNPSGTVPVLELDDGTTISECTAITEYLDHAAPEPDLTGRTPRERAIIAMMQRCAEVGILDAVAAYFHHATPGLGPNIEGFQCSDWGNHQRQRAVAGMRYADDILAARPYLAGDEFSIADITAYAGLSFADLVGIEIPAELAHLAGWRARLAQRPSIAA